jgi:hypothetical protein
LQDPGTYCHCRKTCQSGARPRRSG